MRSNIILFLFVGFSNGVGAQQSATKSQQEVQQSVINLFEALSNRDSVSVKRYCAADAAFYEYGQTWTVDMLFALAITKNKAPDFKRLNRLDFVDTTINGNTAWTTYNLHSEITRDGNTESVHWMETVILVRYEKKWQISVLHSTLIKRS
jgi:hypothetical protein